MRRAVVTLAIALLSTALVYADDCNLCMFNVGQKIQITQDDYGTILFCSTFREAATWDSGNTNETCQNKEALGKIFTIRTKTVMRGVNVPPGQGSFAIYYVSNGKMSGYTMDGGFKLIK